MKRQSPGLVLRALSILIIAGWVAAAQAAWSVGDRVQVVVANAPVYQAIGGRLAGTQSMGTLGVAAGGPQFASSTFWWQVNFDTGADGWIQQLYLTGVPPSAPSLISPGSSSAPGTSVTSLTPTFSWNATLGATNYAFFVSAPVGTSWVAVYKNSTVGIATSFTLPGGVLTYGNAYSWTVQAQDSIGLSPASAALYFQVQVPPPNYPSLTGPGAAASPGPLLATLTPTLSWSPVPGATGYGVYIYDVAAHRFIFFNNGIGNVSVLTLASGVLAYGRAYAWQMTAQNAFGTSAYSPYLYFQSPPAPPPVLGWQFAEGNLVLSWPTNPPGFTLQSAPALPAPTWNAVAGPRAVVGVNYVVTNAASGGAAFFRLAQ